MIFGKPLSLVEKGGLLWELRVEDSVGIRILSVSRVISVGPFSHELPFREYPASSMLFEVTQNASPEREFDIEGWDLELNSARFVSTKIIKSLIFDLGNDRDRVDSLFKKSKQKLRSRSAHMDEPFVFEHEGKWLSKNSKAKVMASPGVPKKLHQQGLMASIECFEGISCQICSERCPESAIQIQKVGTQLQRVLIEDKCTACGICVKVCPSKAISLINESPDKTESRLVLPVTHPDGKKLMPGDGISLMNRNGEKLAQARVARELKTEVDSEYPNIDLLEVAVPTHLLGETRQFARMPSVVEAFSNSALGVEKSVEISLDGNKRRVRDGISVGQALFELGLARSVDVLACSDGSCRRCQIEVDGTKRLACQTSVHPLMHIQLKKSKSQQSQQKGEHVCSCLGITREDVESRIDKGKLSSPEQIRASTHMGEGRCQGQACIPLFNRILQEKGVDGSRWVDWRFPWSEWVVSPGVTE